MALDQVSLFIKREAELIAGEGEKVWKDMGDSSWGINISDINAELPRKVHFDSLSAKALGLALLMLLFGIVLLVQMSYGVISDLHTRHLLNQDGRTADGDIKKISSNRGGQFVRYVFSVEGVFYSGQAEMGGTDYALPGDRTRILIRYLLNDPRVNQPVKWQWVSISDFFPFLLLLSITALGASVILRALRLRTLMRFGIVAAGRVTGCAPNKKLFTVYYEFTAEDNRVEEGSSKLANEYESGASIPIVYLRSNPKRNYRFPVAGFTVAD